VAGLKVFIFAADERGAPPLIRYLKDCGLRVVYRYALPEPDGDVGDFFNQKGAVDVVISWLFLFGGSAVDMLTELRYRRGCLVPVVVVSKAVALRNGLKEEITKFSNVAVVGEDLDEILEAINRLVPNRP